MDMPLGISVSGFTWIDGGIEWFSVFMGFLATKEGF